MNMKPHLSKTYVQKWTAMQTRKSKKLKQLTKNYDETAEPLTIKVDFKNHSCPNTWQIFKAINKHSLYWQWNKHKNTK